MSSMPSSTMLAVLPLFLLLPAVRADTLDSQLTLADKLMPPGLPVVAPTLNTEVERQGRVTGPLFQALGSLPPGSLPQQAQRVHHLRALFQPPPLLPPQPLFNHLDHLTDEVQMNPALKSILKDISMTMADLPLAGEGENQLPGFFAPEFNNRFTPDENAPILSIASTKPRLANTQPTTTSTTTTTTTKLSNQLPLADQQEARPLFPPFEPQQLLPLSNQLPLADPQEARPLFPPFSQHHVAPPSNQLPLDDERQGRPLFPPFVPQEVAPQVEFQVQQTTTTATTIPTETSSQQLPAFVPDTLRSIFPSFSESNFASQLPQFSPQPSNPTTTDPPVTEAFSPNVDHEFHNTANHGFQDQENFELSNEFPPRLNNPAQNGEIHHSHHGLELHPPAIHGTRPNRRPVKHIRKPLPNGSIRKPNKNQGRFVPHNGRVPRQLQRRPNQPQQPLRGIRGNNGRPFDQRRLRAQNSPSVWSAFGNIFANIG